MVVTVDNGIVKPSKPLQPLHSISAAELDQMNIPPIQWIVPGILPVGVAILAAPPKYYKSYMALGLCLAVCDGRSYLGFDTEKHDCLYFDLESTYRRPKQRMDQIMGKNTRRPSNLYIIPGTEECGYIGGGFEDQLTDQLKQNPNVKLVVVDVFQKIRKSRGANQDGYDRDYNDMKALKRIADQNDICILLIHHTTKMKHENDVFNEISGSAGIMGAVDCAWTISKAKRNDNNATLHITGRDLESIELEMEFNRKTYRWDRIGTPEEVAEIRQRKAYDESNIIKAIKLAIENHGGQWSGTASELRRYGILNNVPIHQEPRQIGRIIREFEPLLALDHIMTDTDRKTDGRYLVFRQIEPFNVI